MLSLNAPHNQNISLPNAEQEELHLKQNIHSFLVFVVFFWYLHTNIEVFLHLNMILSAEIQQLEKIALGRIFSTNIMT